MISRSVRLFLLCPSSTNESNKMFECKEDFRLADEDREDEVKTSTSRVRMAADEDELEESFARVMDLLDQVRQRRNCRKR